MKMRVVADERRRGKIERQLLDGGIEEKLRIAPHPVSDALFDTPVQLREVGFHRPGFERNRERLAMQAVLVEIEQHQPTREQLFENGSPTHFGRKQPLLIEQNEFIRLRSEQRDAMKAEEMVAIDGSVFRVHLIDMSDRITERLQGVADDGPAGLAGNMGEILLAQRRDAPGGGGCLCWGKRQ